MTVTVVCAAKPKTVLAYLQRLKQPFIPLEAGYYRWQGQPAIYLIVINELPIAPKNYSLLLFTASERKFREFLEDVVAQRDMVYVRYAYEVRPKLTKEVLTMAGISATLSQEDLKFIAEDIGTELVPFLQTEDLVRGLSAEKKRELISLLKLEELLSGISLENQERLLQLLVKMRSADPVEQEMANGNHSE